MTQLEQAMATLDAWFKPRDISHAKELTAWNEVRAFLSTSQHGGAGDWRYVANRLRVMADDLDKVDEASVQSELRKFADELCPCASADALPVVTAPSAWLVTTTSNGVHAYVHRENIPMETAKFIDPLYTSAPRLLPDADETTTLARRLEAALRTQAGSKR